MLVGNAGILPARLRRQSKVADNWQFTTLCAVAGKMPALPTTKGKLKIKLQRHLYLPRRKCAADCAEAADVHARTVDIDISDI